MTRRDRAALSLAYECVRLEPIPAVGACPRVTDAAEVLSYYGGETAMHIACALESRYLRTRDEWRLLRARLALLLRALLREPAIEGDCVLCGGSACSADDANCIREGGCCPCEGRLRWRRYRALWESAPRWTP